MSRHGAAWHLVVLMLAASVVAGCDLVYPWSKGSTPASPRSVRAELVSFDEVALDWKAEDGIRAYEVSGRFGDGSWNSFGEYPASSSRVELSLDPAVPEAITLRFRVRGFIGGVPSPWSDEVAIARGLRPASGLTAGVIDSWPTVSVQLAWIRGSTTAAELVLERRAVRGTTETVPWERVPGVRVGDVSFTDRGVGGWVDGSRLEYRLRYVLGPFESERVAAATGLAPPLPPTGLAASAPGGLTVHLAWTPISQISWAQQVVQRTPSGLWDWQDVATLGPSVAIHDDTVPVQGAYQYRITVRATDTLETSSSPVQVVTPSGPFVPSLEDLPGVPVYRSADGSLTTVAIAASGLRVYQQEAGGWTSHDIPDPAWNFLAPQHLRAPDGTAHFFYSVSFPGAAHDWRDTGGWHSEALPFRPSDTTIDAGGALHMVACESGFDLSYATNGSGTWVTEPLPHPGTAVTCSIALGSDGEPRVAYAVARPALPGDPYPLVNVQLVVHGALGWQDAPAPASSAVVSSNLEVLRLLAVAGGTTLIIDDGTAATSELEAYDHGPSGWGTGVRLATVTDRVKVAVSADGTRLAVGWSYVDTPLDPANVAVREADGTWTTWPLSGSWVNSLGFSPAGKLWIHTGVALYTER